MFVRLIHSVGSLVITCFALDYGGALLQECMAVRQWRQSDWPVSPFLAIPDPATANQNRLAKGGELRKHPSLTKIYCLGETPDTGAKPTPRPPVRTGRRRDSGKNILEFPEGLKLADLRAYTLRSLTVRPCIGAVEL